MKLKHKATVFPSKIPQNSKTNNIFSMDFAPSGGKVAVSSQLDSKVVMLFDSNYTKQDKIPTKTNFPTAENEVDSHFVTQVRFNKDGTKLAVGQSDGGVFLYKIGQTFREKKAIINKFVELNAIPIQQLCFANKEGCLVYRTKESLKLGNLKSNKSSSIYSANESNSGSLVCFDVGNRDEFIYFGCEDGSVSVYNILTGQTDASIILCPFIQTMVCGTSGNILIATYDGDVICYDSSDGYKQKMEFKFSNQNSFLLSDKNYGENEGYVIVFASCFNLVSFVYDENVNQYKLQSTVPLREDKFGVNISSVAVSPDGNRILLGDLSGAVEEYQFSGKKIIYNNIYEFNFVGAGQVSVSKEKDFLCSLKSKFSTDINQVQIKKNRFIILETKKSIIIHDILKKSTIEVSFNSYQDKPNEYYFDEPGFYFIKSLGDVFIVSADETTGNVYSYCVRPYKLRMNCISVRLVSDCIIAAFLPASGVIRVQNLTNGKTIGEFQDLGSLSAICLNRNGSYLLVQDKKRRLIMLDILKKNFTKKTLLSDCSFATWVPESFEVVVAQCQNEMHIWYNVMGDLSKKVEINGDVVDVQSLFLDGSARTVVVVQNPKNGDKTTINLDDTRISFTAAFEEGDYEKAAIVLEKLSFGSDVNVIACWKTLAAKALQLNKLHIVKRCFAGMNDLVRSREIELIMNEKSENDRLVKLHVFKKQFKVAESILLDAGRAKDAVKMYLDIHKWKDAIRVSELENITSNIKANYFEWLVNSGQYLEAAKVKENDHLLEESCELLGKANFPVASLRLLERYNLLKNPQFDKYVKNCIKQLQESENYSHLAETYLKIDLPLEALNNYLLCHNYDKALELSRKVSPERVLDIEKSYAYYLINSKGEIEDGINHLIEANYVEEALNLTKEHNLYRKMHEILQDYYMNGSFFKGNTSTSSIQCIETLAYHFAAHLEWDKSAFYFKFLIDNVDKGKYEQELLSLLIKNDLYQKAMDLNSEAASAILLTECEKMLTSDPITEKILKRIEQFYCLAGKHDLAIEVYKEKAMYDEMISLVEKYYESNPSIIEQTVEFIAMIYVEEGNFNQAEKIYLQKGFWKKAVNMYINQKRFSDAYRLCRTFSKNQSSLLNQIMYFWVRHYIFQDNQTIEKSLHLISKNYSSPLAIIKIALEKNDFDLIARFLQSPSVTNEVLDGTTVVEVKLALARHYLQNATTVSLGHDLFYDLNKTDELVDIYLKAGKISDAEEVSERIKTANPSLYSDLLLKIGKHQYQAKVPMKDILYLFLRSNNVEVLVELLMRDGRMAEAMNLSEEHNIKSEAISKINKQQSNSDEKGINMVPTQSKLSKSQYQDSVIELLGSPKQSDWTKAIELASVPANLLDLDHVINTAANNFRKAKKYLEAGKLFSSLFEYKKALDCFIEGDLEEEAKFLVETKDKTLMKYYENYKSTKNTKIDVSSSSNEQVLMASNVNNLDLIMNLIKDFIIPLETLDQFMQKFIRNLYENSSFYDPEDNLFNEKTSLALNQIHKSILSRYSDKWDSFEHLWLLHILSVREMVRKALASGIPSAKNIEVIIKQTLILLCYCNETIPLDRVLYEAGFLSKKYNFNINLTFFVWNKFLDVVELIEEGLEDYESFCINFIGEFELASSKFTSLAIRNKCSYTDEVIENVRDFILTSSLENKGLASSSSYSSLETVFPKLFSRINIDCCIVTGYSIQQNQVTECVQFRKKAIKDYWNSFVSACKVCPYCLTEEKPRYN